MLAKARSINLSDTTTALATVLEVLPVSMSKMGAVLTLVLAIP